jgi:hypothetical protein
MVHDEFENESVRSRLSVNYSLVRWEFSSSRFNSLTKVDPLSSDY